MFSSTVFMVSLLLTAPIIKAQVATAVVQSLGTLASAPVAIIKAAEPFNCEFSQASYAVSAFSKIAQNLISTGKPVPQGAINNLIKYAGDLISWPMCWAAEAGRVASTTAQLLKSAIFHTI